MFGPLCQIGGRRRKTFFESVGAASRDCHLSARPVRCEIGLFKAGAALAAAEGRFVHVFVVRAGMTPAPIPTGIRVALERICVEEAAGASRHRVGCGRTPIKPDPARDIPARCAALLE